MLSPSFVLLLQRAEDFGPVEVISHWHPNLTINIVDDHTPWVKGSVPPPLDQCKDWKCEPRAVQRGGGWADPAGVGCSVPCRFRAGGRLGQAPVG